VSRQLGTGKFLLFARPEGGRRAASRWQRLLRASSGLTVSGPGVEGIDLAAQVRFAGGQGRHPGAQFDGGRQLPCGKTMMV
jgi:hypothetical protein